MAEGEACLKDKLDDFLYDFFKRSGLTEFTANPHKLHKIFYYLRFSPDNNGNDILRCFKFRGSPAAPFSNELDTALMKLQLRGLLSKENPRLEKHKIVESDIKITKNPNLDSLAVSFKELVS